MTKQSNRRRAEEAYERLWQHVYEYCKIHLDEQHVNMGEAATIAANLMVNGVEEMIDQGLTHVDIVDELDEVRRDD